MTLYDYDVMARNGILPETIHLLHKKEELDIINNHHGQSTDTKQLITCSICDEENTKSILGDRSI